MEKHEDVASILSMLDLHNIEETITQPYHQEDPGRPPRSPLGIFKALIVKQLRNIPRHRPASQENDIKNLDLSKKTVGSKNILRNVILL